MNLILFGFSSCGKTHFGKKLSQLMHRPCIDTDDLVCQLYDQQNPGRRQGRKVTDEVGLEGFRLLEKQAIFSLQTLQNAIISLGGGAVLDSDTRDLLPKLGALVYLKASPQTIRERLLKKTNADGTPAYLKGKKWDDAFWTMVQERTPIYESLPARTIDTDALDEAGVLASLRSILLLEDKPNGF
ncbi:MAG: hypothetical protein HY069_02380 [Chlamydiia bacterium]|nr:hypothetical protein [Chlamydiia bacterium]